MGKDRQEKNLKKATELNQTVIKHFITMAQLDYKVQKKADY